MKILMNHLITLTSLFFFLNLSLSTIVENAKEMASACQNSCFAFLSNMKSYTTKTLMHCFLLAQNLSFVFLLMIYFFIKLGLG